MFAYVVLFAAMLVALYFLSKGGKSKPDQPLVLFEPQNRSNWEVGPFVNGDRASYGMPVTPEPTPNGWWQVNIPVTGSANYITMPVPSLLDKSMMRARLRLNGTVEPTNFPGGVPLITLFFQRAGDDWTANCEAYRWYASFSTAHLISGEDIVLEAPLTAEWTAMLTSTARNNPDAFMLAKAGACRGGVVLGGGDGLGHGVRGVGDTATLTLLSFEVY